jgi:putative hydrolase of the HAD superfamily
MLNSEPPPQQKNPFEGELGMKIKAVLFDLGGTLVKSSSIPEVMKWILETYGIKRSTEEIEEARKAAEKQVDIKELPVLGDEFWFKWNAQILKHLGIRDNVPFLAEKITKLWWRYAEVELYLDVEKVLRLLKQKGLKVGLITNCLESDVKEILPKVGLDGFFDVEITSDAVGKMKPSKEMFLHALKKLEISPREALFVGDMAEHDYKGAKESGLKALLIDREGNIEEKGVEKIRSLTELLEHI